MEREKSIGIDPSKEKLDVYISETKGNLVYENNSNGIKKLVKLLANTQVDIVTIESTGKYHRKVARELYGARIPILLAQPKRVRDFARGLGVLAKTDPIDARSIALYGQKTDFPKTELPSVEHEQLRDMVARRHQLVTTIASEKNRLQTTIGELKGSCKRIIECLEQEVENLNTLIETQLKKCSNAVEKIAILTSSKGVGQVTAATLIAYLPELGTITKRQVASLVGLAPYNRDSGRMQGKRSIYGGRTIVRSALYMAALSACRYDAQLSQVYQRLVGKGKAKKVALTAVMRKLIVKLNAMIRESQNCRLAST